MLKELSNSAVGERDVLVDAHPDLTAWVSTSGARMRPHFPHTEPKLRPEQIRQSPMPGKRE